MKKRTIIFGFLLVISQLSFAQEEEAQKSKSPILVTIPIPRTETKVKSRVAGSMILDKVQKLIGADYPSSFGVAYKVIPSYAVTAVRTLETMEVMQYVDLEVYLRFRGVGFHKDSLLRVYKATASASDQENAIQKAVNMIFTGGGKIFSFPAMIDSLLNDRYHINGMATLQNLKSYPLTSIKETNQILLELQYFEDYPAMKDAVDAFRNQVMDARSEIFCKNDLPKLKISVESNVYSPTDVVAKLLAISPEASCADEVLALAKVMGQQSMARSESDNEKLNIILSIHQQNNVSEWRRRQY